MKEPPKRKKRGWKMIRDSYHKLWVRFEDGERRTRYSWDWYHSYSPTRDPAIGLARFRKMIAGWGARARHVRIYHIQTDKKIAEYFKGEEVELQDDDP